MSIKFSFTADIQAEAPVSIQMRSESESKLYVSVPPGVDRLCRSAKILALMLVAIVSSVLLVGALASGLIAVFPSCLLL